MNLDELRYHILGRHNLMRDAVPFRNRIFDAWKSLWEKAYGAVDSNYVLKAEEFERQDLVTCIMHGERVAAVHLYSFHHLDSRSCRSTHYFDFFNQNYFARLEGHGVKTAMSMEFLTVLPDYRKSVVGFSLASTLLRLGTAVWKQSGADAVVAPARNDVKANELAYDVGFRCIEKETQQRGFTCDLVALLRGDDKPSSDPRVVEASGRLWQERTVHPSAFFYLAPSPSDAKKAA